MWVSPAATGSLIQLLYINVKRHESLKLSISWTQAQRQQLLLQDKQYHILLDLKERISPERLYIALNKKQNQNKTPININKVPIAFSVSIWAIFNLWVSLLIQLASVWCSILISLPKTPSTALNAIWISRFLSRNGCISLRSDLSSHGHDTVHYCIIVCQPGMQGRHKGAFSLSSSFVALSFSCSSISEGISWCWLPTLRCVHGLAATSCSLLRTFLRMK